MVEKNFGLNSIPAKEKLTRHVEKLKSFIYENVRDYLVCVTRIKSNFPPLFFGVVGGLGGAGGGEGTRVASKTNIQLIR